MELLEILRKVPDVVWSGLLASFLTLAGVMLSNRSNTKRLLSQLRHDADEKQKDRLSVLRKAVDLKAAEETAAAAAYFGRIAQLDSTEQNLGDGLQSFFAVSAQVQLIASPDTVALVSELTARYGEILLTLIQRAQPAHDARIDIDVISPHYDRAQSEVDRILAEMRQLNESGRPDPERMSALQISIGHAQRTTEELGEQRLAHFSARARALKDFAVTCMNELRSTGSLQVQVSVAIRRELNLDSDLVEYEARLEESWQRMNAKMSAFLSQLEES